MADRLGAARERVAAGVVAVLAAEAARDAATDAAAWAAADAELRLQREALAEAHAELARRTRGAKADASQALAAELASLAAPLVAHVDAVLAGARALHRAVSLARARDLRVPQAYGRLPDAAERGLEGFRLRLLALTGARRDDAA